MCKKNVVGRNTRKRLLDPARNHATRGFAISSAMFSLYSGNMGTTGLLTVRLHRSDDDEFIRDVAHESFARWAHAPRQSIMAMVHGRTARTIVAEKDGERLGFAIVSLDALNRAFGPWTHPVVAHLDAIAVRKDARKMGVGQVILAGAETIAREANAVCMSLNTARANRPALVLFGSNGYQATLAIPDFYRGGQAALAMTKLLAK
jgi:ribosomal protein S18 acetylase RimI-like enzyme